MTLVTASGRTYEVSFIHSSHNGETRSDAGALRRTLDEDARRVNRRVTLCDLAEIKAGPDGSSYTLIGQGIAICHPHDQFKKATGRKEAFTAALKASGVSRAERDELWAAYFRAFGR